MSARVVLGFAGLDTEDEDRLRAAGKLLSVFKIEALVQPWGQSRCDVLIARVDAKSGMNASQQADLRSVPVVGLVQTNVAAADSALHRAVPMHKYLEALRMAIASAERRQASLETRRRPSQPVTMAREAGLCLLAGRDDLRGHDCYAVVDGRRIHFRPSTGRVHAASLSDLVAARERLTRPGWSFLPSRRSNASSRVDEVAMTLDGFLLQGAMAGRSLLPPYPDVACRLLDWPDLGRVSDLPVALQMANRLVQGSHRSERLAAEYNYQLDEVAACLWAFRAAGLLQHVERGRVSAGGRAEVRSATNRFSGILTKLARRFGIGGSSGKLS